MFDIRDHGGIFGAGKYRKGLLIPASSFSAQIPIIAFLNPGMYRRAIGVDANYFYVCDAYTIVRFDINTKMLDSTWSISYFADLNGSIATSIIKDGSYYFVAFDSGNVLKYSSYGTKIFKSSSFSAGYFSRLHIYNDVLYYVSNALAVYKVNKDTGVGLLVMSATIGSNYYDFYLYDNYVYCQTYDGTYSIKKYNIDTGELVYKLFNGESYNGASIIDVDSTTETVLFLYQTYIIKRKNGSAETYRIDLGTSDGLGRMIFNKVTKRLYIVTLNTLRCVDTINGILLYTKVMYGSVYKNTGYIYQQTLPDGTCLGNFSVFYNGSNTQEQISIIYEQFKLVE